MIITGAGIVAGIAAAVAIASVVFGMATSHTALPGTPVTSTKVTEQPPATATVPVQDALPAASTSQTTTWNGAFGTTASPAAVTTPATAPKTSTVPAASAVVPAGLGVVVIDAGHQAQGNSSPEPIGPGSSTSKPKVESGATGRYAPREESQVNLAIALKLRATLEARGVTVKMVRTSQKVDIPNSERAKMANAWHAALFIRLHCDGVSSSVSGILTEVPSKNWYADHPIVAKSAVAGKLVQAAVLKATGAHDRGINPVGNLSGFNWSQVPSVLVEMGNMPNNSDDLKLVTPSYQQTLASGMANGIVEFLKAK